MTIGALVTAPLLADASALAQSRRTGDLDASLFREPPPEARIRTYWWWLNGNTDKPTITRELQDMAARGIAGVLIIQANGANLRDNGTVPQGPRFGSPAWLDIFEHALREAERLGIEVTLTIQDGIQLGGPTVKVEDSAKLMTWAAFQVQGGGAVDRILPMPEMRGGFYRDIAVLAYPLAHGAALAGELDARRYRAGIPMLAEKSGATPAGRSVPPNTPLVDPSGTSRDIDTRAADVIDLTASVAADGRLRWTPPTSGDWEILKIGYTSSGRGVRIPSNNTGEHESHLVLDPLDGGALNRYWQTVVEPIVSRGKRAGPRSLRYLAIDSWEIGGVNWTPDFRAQFRTRRGYDLLPFLPIVTGRILGSPEESHAFLNDLRKTVGDLITERFYGRIAAKSAARGLGSHMESGGPHGAPHDALRNLATGSFPQTEFWAESPNWRWRSEQRFFVKQAASAAHIYGKPFVAAEGLTTIGTHWNDSLWASLKPSFDRAVTEGLDRMFWHTFTSSPESTGWPGQEYFAGTHFNPKVTWWRHAGELTGYMNRVQYLMQRGSFVADVLHYNGDAVPNFVRLKDADPAGVLPHHDYDVVNEDVLLNRLSVDKGRLAVRGGLDYAILTLPENRRYSLAALRKLAALSKAGAVIAGERPSGPSGRLSEAEVREFDRMARELWSNCVAPTTTGVRCASAREVLRRQGVAPDVEAPAADPSTLSWVHRRDGDADIYFLASRSPEARRVAVTFRVRGKAPELWDPTDGSTKPMPLFKTRPDGRTTVDIDLDPYGSAALVFRPSTKPHLVTVEGGRAVQRSGGAYLALERPSGARATWSNGRTRQFAGAVAARPLTIGGDWSVSFNGPLDQRAETRLTRLRSWTEIDDPAIRFFSGAATYRTRFEVHPSWLTGERLLTLSLGDVRELAAVRINGRPLRTLWKPPFTAEVGALLRPGANELEIEVTNFWQNRLIGDARLPAEQRRTRTNIRHWTSSAALEPSGLLGPVTLTSTPLLPLR